MFRYLIRTSELEMGQEIFVNCVTATFCCTSRIAVSRRLELFSLRATKFESIRGSDEKNCHAIANIFLIKLSRPCPLFKEATAAVHSAPDGRHLDHVCPPVHTYCGYLCLGA